MQKIINLSTVVNYEDEYCLESCLYYEEAKYIRKCRLFNKETTFIKNNQMPKARRCKQCIDFSGEKALYKLIMCE